MRLPLKVLAAGISADSAIDIEAGQGCIVIKPKQDSQEQALDKLLGENNLKSKVFF